MVDLISSLVSIYISDLTSQSHNYLLYSKRINSYSIRNWHQPELFSIIETTVSDYDSHWKTLIGDIRVLESIPLESYCNRLYNKASNSQHAKQLKNYLQGHDRYPLDNIIHADDKTLDEWNTFIVIRRLTDISLAKAVTDINEKYNTLGLKKCINLVSVKWTGTALEAHINHCLLVGPRRI